MNIAVFTMTRDRLEYTKKCFHSLREKAGCGYDHYLVDNGSIDGTREWIVQNRKDFKRILFSKENMGLLHGFNAAMMIIDGKYDVVVKFDNDCFIETDGTLKEIITLMLSSQWKITVSPRITGLNKPPGIIGKTKMNGFDMSQVNHFGGIFYPLPKELAYPVSGKAFLARGLDWMLSERVRQSGRKLFYCENFICQHIDGTNQQAEKYPEYFERKHEEEKIPTQA